MKIPLVGEDFTSRSIAVSEQKSINVFPEVLKDPNERAKNVAVLYGCPGRHLLSTPGGGAGDAGNIYGLWSGGGRLFIANGNNYSELNEGGGVVATHTLPIGAPSGPAQFFGNGNQLLIIHGGRVFCDSGAGPVACTFDPYAGFVNVVGNVVTWVSGDKFLSDGTWMGRAIVINGVTYTIQGGSPRDLRHPEHATGGAPTPTVLNLTTSPGTLTNVAYSALGAPVTAVTGGYMNGTFFVQRPRGSVAGAADLGKQINFSGSFNGASWNGLDFFTKEGAPDYIRGILVDNQQLYAFGDETFEVYQADPNPAVGANPFPAIQGAMGRFGSSSPWGAVAIDGRVFFLGGDSRGGLIAYVMDGFTPKPVSTHAEESVWNAATVPVGVVHRGNRQAICYAYSEGGHSFWVINLGSQTWVYDTGTGAWHQRAQWDGTVFTPYQTNLHTYIQEWSGGKHITAWSPFELSGGSPGVYESSVNFYDDAGGDIKWQRTLPYIYHEGKWQFFGRLELEMETGTVAAGAEPVITMDYSDDRGKTFINPRIAGIGAAGESSRRVFWLRGGKSRGRVPRLSGVGQSKVALIDLDWDIALGTV